MSVCFICNKSFSKVGKGSNTRKMCYDCMPTGLSKRQRYNRRRDLYTIKAQEEKLEQGCSICGYNRCVRALEWHHIDGDDKHDNPSRLLDCSWEFYKKETSKCVLLCSNCHREVHEGILKL